MNLERATKEGNSPVNKKFIFPAIIALLTLCQKGEVLPDTCNLVGRKPKHVRVIELYGREDRLPRLNIFHDR